MLGREMKIYRKDKNLTLKDMSKRTGLTTVYLSQIERGLNTPQVMETLKKISEGYGIFYPRVVECVLEGVKRKINP